MTATSRAKSVEDAAAVSGPKSSVTANAVQAASAEEAHPAVRLSPQARPFVPSRAVLEPAAAGEPTPGKCQGSSTPLAPINPFRAGRPLKYFSITKDGIGYIKNL